MPRSRADGPCSKELQLEVVGADIDEGAVVQAKACGDGAELFEADRLIKVAGAGVGGSDGVELHDLKSQLLGLGHRVEDQQTATPLFLALDLTA